MPRRSDPSHIYDDPALADRQGDATGPVALVFLGAVVMVFVVGAVALLSLPTLVVDPTPRPASTARTATSVDPTPSLTVRATAAAPSTPPSASAPPSLAPGETPGALPSRQPTTPSATPTGAVAALRTGTFRKAVPLEVDGERIGSVNVRSLDRGRLDGVDLPDGARLMVLEVRLRSSEAMAYDAADWVVVDTDGERHPSLGDRAPGSALGSGRLAAGDAVVGTIAFIREQGVTFERFVLTDGAGRDLLSVVRPGLVEAVEGG